jgi:hypothetical protein
LYRLFFYRLFSDRVVASLVSVGDVWIGIVWIGLVGAGLFSGTSISLAQDSKNRIARIETKSEGMPAEVVEGRVLDQDDADGYLIEERSGRLRLVSGIPGKKAEITDRVFTPLSIAEMTDDMLKKLPQGFRAKSVDRFLLLYDTSDAYAKWNLSLYERLNRGFEKFWKNKGMELSQPEFPLVTIVFQSRDGFLNYASEMKVEGAENMIGYYHQPNNWVVTYDVTGVEAMIADQKTISQAELVKVLLKQPGAERNVATMLHEAVHQLAYNRGLQRRLASHNPVAISEGLALFFETPDLRSSSGWSGIGTVNQFNLARFQQYMAAGRSGDSLSTLISSDDRFTQIQSIEAAYGESWALTYFLLKTRGKDYVEYLRDLHSRPMTFSNSSKQRLADLQKHFGNDLQKLDRDFLKFMSNIR